MKSKGILFVLLLLAIGIGFLWQYQAGSRLHGEAIGLQAQAREAVRLREENRRLASEQASPEEMENLRADHAEMERLRGEIEALSRRVEQAEAKPASPAPAASMGAAGPSGSAVAAGAWRNAGRTTPEAALETALWSAKEGDINSLAGMLLLDDGARAKAEQLLAGLPEATRAQYATPEQLVAFLTAKDVPLTSMRVAGMTVEGDEAQLVVHLPTAQQPDKMTKLGLHRSPDGWRFKVPESAVDRYSQALTGKE
jgi:hypothetical protein